MRLKLRNYDPIVKCGERQRSSARKRHPLVPETPGRFLICGPSGSGKTNVVLNLIYDLLPWTRLYIYAKDLTEPKYEELRTVCEAAQAKEPFHFSFDCDSESIVSPDELDPSEQNLIIFDDFCLDREALPAIGELFIRGRKKNATVVFITQSFFHAPKLIRLQCTCYILFGVNDNREVSEIYKNQSCGMSRLDFVRMFHVATSEPHSFLCIDKQSPVDRQFRKNFDCFF